MCIGTRSHVSELCKEVNYYVNEGGCLPMVFAVSLSRLLVHISYFQGGMYNGCEIISYKLNRSHTQQANHKSLFEVEGCIYEAISTILMTPTWC